MIQLRKSGVVVDREDVERLRSEFAEKHCVLLPKLLESALLEILCSRLDRWPWRDREHKGIGVEVVSEDQTSIHLLQFLANTASFLTAVRQITACPSITWFGGRIYRMIPNSGHYDSWHADSHDNREVGMSLNLSPQGYQGGLFQMRERISKRALLEIANVGFGDATLFRISESLDHQVTRVEGARPKTAFAGWFQSGKPNLRDRLLMTRESQEESVDPISRTS